jgi:hypothetical protein
MIGVCVYSLEIGPGQVKTSYESVFQLVRFQIQNVEGTRNSGREAPQTRASVSATNPQALLLARRPAMVIAAFASTSTTADGYSYLAPNPTARDPVRRRTTPLLTATNRHVHGRTATSLRQARPRNRFVNPPRPLFAAAADTGEMAAAASTGMKPFAVLFVCLGKSRESPLANPLL